MSVTCWSGNTHDHECQQCGNEAGGNGLYLGFPTKSQQDGSVYEFRARGGRRGEVWVCDECLWATLRASFGHLLNPGR